MEVRQTIDELRSSLEHIIDEEELLELIAGRVSELRRSYPSHRSHFSREDIVFLKSLSEVSDHLRAFIEIKEELPGVDSLREYETVVGRLTRIKGALGCLAVARRVAKEIRELNERLPEIRECDSTKREFRLTSRIVELDQPPRLCPRKHPMVIREGSSGYFWGCSRYPFCDATAPLRPEERALLNPK